MLKQNNLNFMQGFMMTKILFFSLLLVTSASQIIAGESTTWENKTTDAQPTPSLQETIATQATSTDSKKFSESTSDALNNKNAPADSFDRLPADSSIRDICTKEGRNCLDCTELALLLSLTPTPQKQNLQNQRNMINCYVKRICAKRNLSGPKTLGEMFTVQKSFNWKLIEKNIVQLDYPQPQVAISILGQDDEPVVRDNQ